MSRHRRIEDVITDWLVEEAPDQLPEWAFHSAMNRARVARRRSTLGGWRWSAMTRSLPVAAGLVGIAVVAVIVITASMFGGSGPGRGGVVPSSTARAAVATAQPPSPSPTAELPFEGVRAFEDVPGGGRLAPGTYSLSSIAPLEIRFTVPSGWERPPNAPQFLGPTGMDGREIGGLSFWAPAGFYATPCQSEGSFVELAADASVDSVVDRLAAYWNGAMPAPTATTLGGFSGLQTTVTATCDGAIATYHVLDVEGQTLIVLKHVWGQTGPEGAAELEAMVQSVDIDVVGG